MTTTASRAVIWDMDGTLVDTGELHFRAWQKFSREELGRDFTRDDFAATFGKRNPEIFDYLLGEGHDDAKTGPLGDRKEEHYREEARAGVDLLPGARPLLEALKEEGYVQAIGSSGPRANVQLILELTGADSLMDAVACAEDTERGKPDPQVFQVAAEKLGVEPKHCVVVEDAVAGIEAAKSAGMKCVAVTFVGHHPAEKLRAAGADLVVSSLKEVSVSTIDELLG